MGKHSSWMPKLNILLISAVLLLGLVYGRLRFLAREAMQEGAWESGMLCLNEICSSNFSSIASEDGEYYDYVELYNPTEEEISLEGYALSDYAKDLKRFVFGGRTIPAKGYIVVYAAGEEGAENDQCAGFKISSGGESLFLSDPQGNVIDSVVVPADMKYNTSYARDIDGTGSWTVLEATPGYTNNEAERCLPESLEAPVFSAESGFYEEPFLLELQAQEGCRIYYTLDGSEPGTDAILYTEPVAITDASVNENTYSARTDLSAAFFTEEDRFAVPSEKVDKAVILRAAAFDEEGNAKSETVTKTYFIGYGQKAYEDFAVMSLVTDPDNLFDYEKGIYVSGKRFDEFVASGEIEETSNPANWRRWLGNYSNRGREWERPVHIDFFDASRSLLLSQEAGVRIKGGTSRSFTQKSLSLYARDIYSGTDEFYLPFFGEYGRKRVALFSGAQDYRTKIQDALVNSLCKGRAFSVMESYPCYVFLDGEYWGIYHLMENYGDSYLEERYGVPKGEGIIIKNGSLDTDAPGSEAYAEELYTLMESDTPIDGAEYERINRIIDMQSYIDYYAAEIYINRGEEDWPRVNEACWRTIDDLGGAYSDGKWRWMLFDTNWACLNAAEENAIAYTKEHSNFFSRLCRNEEFRESFVKTMCDLMNTSFRLENVAPVFMELTEQMRGPVVKDLKKYYGDSRTEEDFEKEIQSMAVFFQERPEYMLQYLAEEFALEGTPETVTVYCTEGGAVMLNTVQIPQATEGWAGRYFTDYPVTLTAVPAQGYAFAGWSGDVVSAETAIETEVKPGGITLYAAFEKQ